MTNERVRHHKDYISLPGIEFLRNCTNVHKAFGNEVWADRLDFARREKSKNAIRKRAISYTRSLNMKKVKGK